MRIFSKAFTRFGPRASLDADGDQGARLRQYADAFYALREGDDVFEKKTAAVAAWVV